MKKILFVLLLISVFAGTNQAAAQQKKFYYYPSSNVYYDVGTNQYIYLNNGNWVHVNTLPARYRVTGARRVIVYNSTPQIWQHNGKHKIKYKNNYPKGKAVGYKGTNPNKAGGKTKIKSH